MKILCAGPTSIDQKVLARLAESKTNPDLDPAYAAYHHSVEQKISTLLHTDAKTILMLGEAIITLEAAVCSLMEPKERVLVLSNGFFGKGFVDYVNFFGGEAVLWEGDPERGLNANDLQAFLEKDHDFALATMVHCETPSGITNDIGSLCPLLKEYGILSIVDGVSSLAGEDISFDDIQVDAFLGGSQKCLSAPVGLGSVTLSKAARAKIEQRKTPVLSYYMNLKNYYAFEGEYFPYTMNENLIYAIDEALDQAMAKDSVGEHKRYAENTRLVFERCGFSLYPKDSFSNTLTAIRTPENITSEAILNELRKEDIIISKGLGHLKEKIFRVGHMGNNISYDNFKDLYLALDRAFSNLSVKTQGSLYDTFVETMLP